jgi:hypothetical protein
MIWQTAAIWLLEYLPTALCTHLGYFIETLWGMN